MGLAAVAAAPAAGAAWLGFVRTSAAAVESPRDGLQGGLGRLDDADAAGERAESLGAEARLALDAEPGIGWRVVVHAAARTEPTDARDADLSGLVEAFVERRAGFGEGHEIVGRAGLFFLDTTREAVAELWTSPYTLTPSALTTWIGEEVRPLGLDLAWRRTTAAEHRFTLGATAFGGDDTAGTLVGWRGFVLHDRPTPLGGWLPLPELEFLPEVFPLQSPRGTRPFGDDLDGRVGAAGRVRWEAPGGRGSLQATVWDNRGDRAVHGDQYAWATRFALAGGDLALPGGGTLAGEWLRGTTEMGFAPPGSRSRSVVDARFDAAYLLASWPLGPARISLRHDRFEVEDRDDTPRDDNREDGSAWTLAVLWDLGERWRIGLEWVDVEARRPVAAELGDANLDGDALRAELRFRF